MGQSVPVEPSMAERVVRRRTPQQSNDTTALQAVERLAGVVEGHDQRDDDRFDNLREDVKELKGEIKQLNVDAKQAIEALDRKGEGNHKDNQNWMQRLELKLDGLSSRNAGAAWLGMTIREWLILIIAASALISPFLRHP